MEAIGQISANEWLRDSDIQELFTLLEDKAMFVGGCVRDALLFRPVKDIDIATEFTPDEVTAKLSAAGIKTVPAGISFGMVMAITRTRKQAIEITTLRKDIATDGRRATVVFGTNWHEDALRRDFTVNAFYADKEGLVYDPLDNFADLSAGKIRFIGDASERIKEDALRILRFFRFYAYYGQGSPDKNALKAIGENSALLKKLSKERIKEEFFKIMLSPHPDIILESMQRSGILDFITPDIRDIPTLGQLVWLETRGIVLSGIEPDLIRRLAAILPLDTDKITAQKKNLRLSNLENKELEEISHAPEIISFLNNQGLEKSLYTFGRKNVIAAVLLFWAKQRAEASYISFADDNAKIRLLESACSVPVPEFPLRGLDLEVLGLTGKSIGETLKNLEKYWLDSNFTPDKKQLLEYAMKKV